MMVYWAQAETPERVSREPNSPALENKKAASCQCNKKLQALFHNMFFAKRSHNFEFFMDKNPFLWYNKK